MTSTLIRPGPAVVVRGDAANLPLPDASVDLVVTSPPYFGLRSYTDGGAHYEGQVGDEATPAEYLDALMRCTSEWVRVLKPGGSIFVNLGDKYVADNRGSGTDMKRGAAKWAPPGPAGYPGEGIMPRKSLMMLPQRYAIRCIDELGLIARAEIVWSKPNGLPESVTDRVRRSHEQVFHLTKQPRYYSAVDEVREEYQAPTATRTRGAKLHAWAREYGDPSEPRNAADQMNPLGKLPGSVWEIPTAPLTVPEWLGVDHFAAFPPELVRRIVAGWSPREVCTACGEGRRPVTLNTPALITPSPRRAAALAAGSGSGRTTPSGTQVSPASRVITGYVCACPDTSTPTTPGLVVDPFGGTGTTALVASVLGRVGITVDLSADYCRLAQWRTTDPGERARALGVPKPPEPVEGQLDMFGDGLGA